MKRSIRYLAFLLAIFTLFGLISCTTHSSEETTTIDDLTYIDIVNNSQSEYTFIVPMGKDTYYELAFALSQDILQKTGVTLKVKYDSFSQSGKEILIGETSRGYSQKYISKIENPNDAILTIEDGNIVLYSKDIDGVESALQMFTSFLKFDEINKTCKIADSLYFELKGENKYLTLVGDNKSEYQIVYESKYETLANNVSTLIEQTTGVKIPVVNESDTEQKKEILIGTGGRKQGKSICKGLGDANIAKIVVKDEKVVLAGNCELSVNAAVALFTEKIEDFLFQKKQLKITKFFMFVCILGISYVSVLRKVLS